MTDPTPLVFVNPDDIDPTYRVCLWAAPGQGKSVAAASAPGPILVVSADRPSAYRFARKHHKGKRIDEARYTGPETLAATVQLLKSEPGEYRTVIIDPSSHIVDQLADVAPPDKEGGPNYQWVNKQFLNFVKALRGLDVNVILVAHEKVNDGKKGDGKLYPALGGPSLINKLLAEMDIVAHIERREVQKEGEDPRSVWAGQIQPRGSLVCKDSTGALGEHRVADLSRWFVVANEALAPDESDLPWGDVPIDEEIVQAAKTHLAAQEQPA